VVTGIERDDLGRLGVVDIVVQAELDLVGMSGVEGEVDSSLLDRRPERERVAAFDLGYGASTRAVRSFSQPKQSSAVSGSN
jgi:hypothetical protein